MGRQRVGAVAQHAARVVVRDGPQEALVLNQKRIRRHRELLRVTTRLDAQCALRDGQRASLADQLNPIGVDHRGGTSP